MWQILNIWEWHWKIKFAFTKMQSVFQDAAQRSLVETHRRFGGTCCLIRLLKLKRSKRQLVRLKRRQIFTILHCVTTQKIVAFTVILMRTPVLKFRVDLPLKHHSDSDTIRPDCPLKFLRCVERLLRQYNRGAQILGNRSPWQQNFLQWRLIFLDP
jgi:hypothetical protein